MKKWMFLFCFVLSLSRSYAQGIEFFHGTWAEALEKAKQEDKIIFVDAFAKWCGPCKRMAATVFTDQSVGEFVNQNFIPMKIDMEEGEGLTFRDKFPVTAYPTLMFIDPNKEDLLQKQVGALQVEQFLELGKTVLSKIDNSGDFALRYQNGNRDPDMILGYIKALNKANKPSLKIANDYLLKQTELSTPDNLRIIFEATTEADSRIFDLLIKYKGPIAALVTEDAVKRKIENACKATDKKAIEFKSDELHAEAKNKMKQYCPDKADTFILDADLRYALAKADAGKYVKAAEAYLKKAGKNNALQLNSFASQVLDNFSDNRDAMKKAEKWAEKASEYGGLYSYYATYAEILFHNGDKKSALEMAQKSLEIAKSTNPAAVPGIENLVHKIQEG